MASTTLVLRVLADGPGVVVSAALIVMTTALVPGEVAVGSTVLAITVLAVLATGGLEQPTVRLVAGARPLSEAETAVLAAALARLEAADLGPPTVALYIRRWHRRPGPMVAAMGRSSLVVSADLIDAVSRRRIDNEEAAALLTHGVGRLRYGATRFDLALRACLLPWRLVSGLCHRIGAAAAWVPLIRQAWQLRAGVAAVAVVQSVAAGRLAAASVVAVFTASTYAVPWCARAAEQRLCCTADAFVVENGLGPALAALLRRRAGSALQRERLHRLRVDVRRPHLSVVREGDSPRRHRAPARPGAPAPSRPSQSVGWD